MLVESGEKGDNLVTVGLQHAVQAQRGILPPAPAKDDFFFGLHAGIITLNTTNRGF